MKMSRQPTKLTKAPKPRPAIVSMDPYRPPSTGRGNKMRLDFNENTVGCSPVVIARMKRIKAAELAVYPEYHDALPKFAKHFKVRPDQLTLTNGTDEAIQLVVNTYAGENDTVVVLHPSYAMYRFYSQISGAKIVEVGFQSDLGFPQRDLLAAVKKRGVKAVFVANPNNPTGTLASSKQVREILEAAPGAAVMIDEAYFEFCGQTAIPWIPKYSNLFVSRTFSKTYGLAAMRLGCLLSNSENMAAIRKGQSPYSVNSVAVACGLDAIQDPAYVRRYAEEAIQSRKMLCDALDSLGWHYYPSAANFVLVHFGEHSQEIRQKFNEHDILVRDRSYEIPGSVRITVGTLAQTRKMIQTLRKISAQLSASEKARSAR